MLGGNMLENFWNGVIGTYINNPNILVYTIVFVLLCVILKLFYPSFRGFMGEFWVKMELKILSKKKYIVLNDIMIKDEWGTHQIDHIVLSNYGIFVIEMKNYSGLISGSEYSNKWCQHLGKNKNYFFNPIYQNYGHIKALSKLLSLDARYFISIVCFSNQAKIKVNCKSIVTHVDNLVQEILKYKEIIFEDDINKFVLLINSNNITDKNVREEHVKRIHEKILRNKEFTHNMICPVCGHKLVLRSGKYGEFIGCSNYPKCHYTKNNNG